MIDNISSVANVTLDYLKNTPICQTTESQELIKGSGRMISLIYFLFVLLVLLYSIRRYTNRKTEIFILNLSIPFFLMIFILLNALMITVTGEYFYFITLIISMIMFIVNFIRYYMKFEKEISD